MSGLPAMVNSDGIRKWHNTTFRGYNHTEGAGDGELWDMENLTSDLYPVLSPRKPRYLITTLTKPNGFYAKDGLYWVDGTGFYKDGVRKGDVADSKKQFASLGTRIVIMPDKKYYDAYDNSFGSLEASVTASCKIQDGTYAGETAEANTIYSASVDWAAKFNVGDAVTISGATTHTENNQTIIVREISGHYMRFYENSFTINTGGDTETLTVARTVPDMDFICENENRLWGCKGDTIYASKLGDIFNWNVFDGISTDSYAVDVGSGGDFTACCSFLGYPCFFKEDHIYKIYGEKVSAYQVMGSASLGVEKGSYGSLAIAGEILFYLSRVGVVAYSGGIPQSVAAAFGTDRYKNAVGGSDGEKYYVSMQGTDGAYTLFVFDTRLNVWHKEDGKQIVGFGWNGELYFLDSTGKLWMSGRARTAAGTIESAVESAAEFADFTDYASKSPQLGANKKWTGKIQIRMELETGATVTVKMKFDSGETWETVAELTAAKKRSYYLPIIPRRSDHYRIRIEGKGDYRLYSLVREDSSGSEL